MNITIQAVDEGVTRAKITFPEVHSLKYISGCDSISFSCLQELRDLLHLFEGHLRLGNLLDGLFPPRIKAVDKSTEDLGHKKNRNRSKLTQCADHIKRTVKGPVCHISFVSSSTNSQLVSGLQLLYKYLFSDTVKQ